MRRLGVALTFLFSIMAITLLAQKGEKKLKPWTEWTQKDAEKLLDNSGWSQTQVMTDISQMFYSPANSSRSTKGAVNQAVPMYFRICFLTAKPVRQAWARLIELKSKPNPAVKKQLVDFVEGGRSDEWITIAVSFRSDQPQYEREAMQAFNSATSGLLKNNTYLEMKNGTRQFLDDYRPGNEPWGSMFRFKRVVDGKPFITPECGEVRFYTELNKDLVLNMRFKVADFNYEGSFEY